MIKIEKKVTLISILVGLVGIATTVYSFIHPITTQDKEQTHSITIINNATASSVIPSTSNSPTAIINSDHDLSNQVNHKESASKREKGTAHLTISATGARVKILEGDSDFPYSGGEISSTGAEQVVYLPKNQALSIDLEGTGAKLSISHHVAKQVSVNNSGIGAKVFIF